SILVQVKKSIIGDKLMEEAIAEGLVIDKIGQKRTKTDKNGQPIDKKTNVFPSAFIKTVYETIKSNPKAKYSWLEDNLGVNERTIRRAVEELKKLGYINPEHSKMGGEWQLLK
ncbi:MAG: transcriptional regulator, partial [Bacteroidaceae bacterium]|nr:transcriptional regulator [Bacteroidaceae bacterium]